MTKDVRRMNEAEVQSVREHLTNCPDCPIGRTEECPLRDVLTRLLEVAERSANLTDAEYSEATLLLAKQTQVLELVSDCLTKYGES